MPALILALVVLATMAGPAQGQASPEPQAAERVSVLGRSVEGRPIRLIRVGEPRSPRRVLVVGAIHGNEPAGKAVVRGLRRRTPPAGVELWLVPDLNPDGAAAGTRQNARGVDLNRNFPHRWRSQGTPGSTFHSGPRPLSEPESRLAARLIARLRPDVTLWYHQALALVTLGSADPAVARRYARVSGLPARRLGFLPGLASHWQRARLPKTSALVVELPAGALDPAGVARQVRAVRAVAGRSRRPVGRSPSGSDVKAAIHRGTRAQSESSTSGRR